MIEKSRQQQISKRINEKVMTKKEEKEFTEFWKIRNEELHMQESQEKEDTRQRQVELKAFQKYQLDNKQKKIEEDYKKQLEEATNTQALLDQKDKEFYSYAEKCIKEWKDAGKNVTPLIMELKSQSRKGLSQV